MKKIVVLLLFVISTSVVAEWTKACESGNGNMTVYADIQTITKKENKVRIWVLFDFKLVQKFEKYRFLSSVIQDEYDCEEKTQRPLETYWFSENMKGGEIVVHSDHKKNKPESIMPGTPNLILFNIACGKQ